MRYLEPYSGRTDLVIDHLPHCRVWQHPHYVGVP